MPTVDHFIRMPPTARADYLLPTNTAYQSLYQTLLDPSSYYPISGERPLSGPLLFVTFLTFNTLLIHFRTGLLEEKARREEMRWNIFQGLTGISLHKQFGRRDR